MVTDYTAGFSTGGPQDEALRFRLEALTRRQTGVRYIDYRQAELDCEKLAMAILDVVPPEEIGSWSFVPIPRGGMIVLGILSYFLDLDPAQLTVRPDRPGPVVIVDDVALTGARFARTLSTMSASRVVFAHLYSHPDLRAAIEAAEPLVERCLAAHDLSDHIATVYPDPGQRREWQRWWLDRLGSGRYWFGQPEAVAFPWNEPDSPLWNPGSGEIEQGWRLVPPHRCLGNRADLGIPPRLVINRRWVVSDGVAIGVFEDRVHVAKLPSGEVYGFQGVAADMWCALASYGDVPAVVDHLLKVYQVDGVSLREDIERFLIELVALGLLTEVQDADAPA